MIAVIKNSLWLMLEKVLFALAGIFISVYVARYLQPEKFGVITYLLAIVAITVPLIQLGADNVIFNRIARRESAGIRLMLMSAKLRGFLFIFTSIAILLWGGIYLPAEQKWMLVLVLASSWFSIQDVYRIYYDATLRSKKNTFINNAGMMLSMLLRVVLVKASMGMAWFIIPYIVSSAVPYFIRRRMFKRSHPPTMKRKRWKKRQGRYNSYMFKIPSCHLSWQDGFLH
ncbi:oligosaccharide flippase family protein [Edaphovirga cremea]|uniref:oligosaccharide flippase family protein n=1 Tax=Edaphovirga cremea TaxID=2267246 RepID=UPI000DEFEF80|nr:oligosaccharide flippase family protein [Edaphovirga cremea]